MRIQFISDMILVIDKTQNKTAHAHYAIQVIFTNSPLYIENRRMINCTVINSHVNHFFDLNQVCVSLFINPQSVIGQNLCEMLGQMDFIQLNHPIINEFGRLLETDVSDSEINDVIEKMKAEFSYNREMDERIKDTLNYIDSQDGLDLSIDALAKRSHLSSTRFTHLFKEEIGLSVMRYISWIKLMNAFKYILLEDTTISEGAFRYGFSDSAHFSRTFKKNFGINLKHILTHSASVNK